jgi:6-methylsalicylate decarboxylase
MIKPINRRTFIRNASALGGLATFAGALPAEVLSAKIATDTKPSPAPRRVDVHHHILPPDYVKAVGDAAIGAPNNRPTGPSWSIADSIETMDKFGIQTAFTSISSPGIPLDDAKAVQRTARGCNDFAKQMTIDHPGRFGVFAFLPLPDVAASLEEVAYVYDALHVDGIALHTNYRALYLGDPHFAPLMDELNRRKAVVFVHPTVCSCTAGAIPGVTTASIEYPHDTTRTITSLLFNGTFKKNPDIRFIFSHAGGTMPFLVNRIASLPGTAPEGPTALLKRQYFELAQSANPQAMIPLLNMVDASHVLFGTDFPYVRAVNGVIDGIANASLKPKDVSLIERDNAIALFPRLAS